jgi:hypothetical protein
MTIHVPKEIIKTKYGKVKQRGICIRCDKPTHRHVCSDYCSPCLAIVEEEQKARYKIKREAKNV